MLANKEDLLIMPLGGFEQIGANCAMIGNDNEWIIVDLGIAFYDKYGIEILTPDISFPISVKDHVKGIFITHAHEDHIGGLPYLWPKLRCPIYVTEFPAAILAQKFKEYSWKKEPKINKIEAGKAIKVGSFEIEYVKLPHSILGSCGIYIKTKAGNIFHTGDWKIDETPLLGDQIDEKRLEAIGKEGVDCLLCDSTNILVNDNIGSEMDVKTALKRVMSQYSEKRITVTCFASNVARMATIFSVAKSLGRKVAIIGRSINRMINAVSSTSYFSKEFKNAISAVVSDEEAASMPFSKVLLICTGSQGESKSALFRLSRGENRVIKLGKNDAVLFSSKAIPGNELEIREMQNSLVKQGTEIVTTDTEEDMHVSGHPNKKAIKKMFAWLNPKTVIPIHGDAMMLHAHAKFAQENGIHETMVVQSGDIISVLNGRLKKISHRDVIFNALDGSDLIPINSKAIRERELMSYNGLVSVSMVLTENNTMLDSPAVSVHGIYMDKEVIDRLEKMIRKSITSEIVKHSSDIDAIRKNSVNSIKGLIFRHFEKKPLVAIHIHKTYAIHQ
ncbi:MAG: ribonuclease J [Holosporales bacterium]|jgi:ribonuclease J|nr:ribonuclease J [Holosporales bacterium]